jgi:hypothetical protein
LLFFSENSGFGRNSESHAGVVSFGARHRRVRRCGDESNTFITRVTSLYGYRMWPPITRPVTDLLIHVYIAPELLPLSFVRRPLILDNAHGKR